MSTCSRNLLHGAASLMLVLSLAAPACDQSFYFDVPRADALPDAGPPRAATGCSTDADCPFESLHCDARARVCLECVRDEHCSGTTPRCEPNLHRCVECSGSHDCAAGLACDATTRRCLASCADEPDCPASAPECDERRGVCVTCDEDAECREEGGRPYCALDGSRCLECRSDVHCADGLFCDPIWGACVACRDSADCATPQVCDPTTRTCAPPRPGPR